MLEFVERYSIGFRGIVFSAFLGVFSVLAGLLCAYVTSFAFPFISAILIYPLYYVDLRKGRSFDALYHVLVWAFFSSLTLILLTVGLGEGLGVYIVHGVSYRDEMFSWIRTGVGAEGDPHLFILPKIKELALFSLLTLVSGGFLGLMLGSMLLNFMNFYVGCLFLSVHEGYFWVPLFFGWQIYAVLRVIGYVNLGILLSMPLYRRLLGSRFDSGSVRRHVLLVVVCIALDFLLKGTVANAFYQPLLKKALYP